MGNGGQQYYVCQVIYILFWAENNLCFIGSVSMSENGWTSDFLCVEWFEKLFIPHMKTHGQPDKPILLIYGHGSHEADCMHKLALVNNIHLFCLPPHTTHQLQPLHVSVFGPFQNTWQKECQEVLTKMGKEVILKSHFEGCCVSLHGCKTESVQKGNNSH